MRKRLLICISFLLFFFCNNNVSAASVFPELTAVRDKIEADKYIVHAAGALKREVDGNDWKYSNSHEGLYNCLSNGKNIVELDFLLTTDNHLICAHDWDRLYLNGTKITAPISLSEAFNAKVYEEFTPLWLGDIINYLYLYPELYIVTDMKEDDMNLIGCKLISTYCPELMNRFVIQIYHEEEYEAISEMGFENIIFTLYKTKRSERKPEKLIDMADRYSLVGYTFPEEFVTDVAFFDGIKNTGVPLYVHTINEMETQQYLFQQGISAVYTDRVIY